MARDTFNVELGYGIDAENGDLLVQQLAGATVPGGDTGPQDDSPIGSTYQRTNGEFYTKIADANATADWELKSAGNNVIMAGYTPANGTVTVGDTYDEAFEKLDGNQQDIQTASGLAQGAVDNGTFTGTTITDNVTTKVALQELETAYEETDANVDDLITLSGVAENATDLGSFTGNVITDNSTVKVALQELETFAENISGGSAIVESGVTTLQDIDTVLVDDVHAVEWEIVVWEEATPVNKRFFKLTAMHDGTAVADATDVDHTKHTRLRHGGNFNRVFTVDVNGVGAAQTMRLRASSSTAGIAMEVRRTSVV